ncbi:MAG: helix-turn-helix domain-containing protein [Pseudomonadota bacterium]
MSTVDKALGILDLFSESRPSIGLSEVARLLNKDKASVQRYLVALLKRGFLDQDPVSKLYHLGPAMHRLALVREQTYPIEKGVRRVLTKLVEDTGETAHASHIQNGGLSEVAIVETSFKGTRVYIDPSELLPLHASASGLAYLSALSPLERRKTLGTRLE